MVVHLQVHRSNVPCSAVLCSNPVDIVNGMVTFTGNSVGDTATYTCDPGFELIGTATITCTQVDENNAEFSSVIPLCRREYSYFVEIGMTMYCIIMSIMLACALY